MPMALIPTSPNPTLQAGCSLYNLKAAYSLSVPEGNDFNLVSVRCSGLQILNLVHRIFNPGFIEKDEILRLQIF